MYIASAAAGTHGLQSRAQAAAAAKWGGGRPGQEVIGHSVCKGKYQPWRNAVRQYGCARHHFLRKAKIDKYGLREGWESFEQWPMP